MHVMSIPNGVLLHFVFFLLSTSLFSPKWVVHGEKQSDTKRPDPLRHLKNYNGTYNIQSKDYWAVSSNNPSLLIQSSQCMISNREHPSPNTRVHNNMSNCVIRFIRILTYTCVYAIDFDISCVCSHIFQSAAFTGLYGYIIAGVWLLCGMGIAIFLTCKHPNIGNSRIKHFLDRHSILMFLLVLIFTLLAM